MDTDPTHIVQNQTSGPNNENDQNKDKPDFEILTTVFYYCFTIIVMPILTFFVFKHVLFSGVFGVDSVSSNVYSAIAAIVVVHISLAMFIYKAYTDASIVKPVKQD